MGGGLVIVEPTTMLRDWLRASWDPQLWAGGWPDTADLPGTVMHPITSTLNGAITTWSWQFDSFHGGARHDGLGQPGASATSARLATHLLRTPPRTVIGANADVAVLFGGAIESSVSIAPKPPDLDDPDVFGATLLIDLTTISVPNP